MSDEAKPTLTEAIVLGLLRDHLAKGGNGGAGEYAFLPQVRNGAGFSATRTFDGISLSLWPSRGLVMHVYEVKVSRSDWLREHKNPAKAEDACKIAEHFSIVAPAGVVKDAELPPTWGLIQVHGDGTEEKPWRLRTKIAAPLLIERGQKNRGPLDRSLVAAMLRSVPGAVPGGRVRSALDEELAAARDQGHKAGFQQGKNAADREQGGIAREVEAWRNLKTALLDAGLDRYVASPGSLAVHAEAIVAAMNGQRANQNLENLKAQLERAVKMIEEIQTEGS